MPNVDRVLPNNYRIPSQTDCRIAAQTAEHTDQIEGSGFAQQKQHFAGCFPLINGVAAASAVAAAVGIGETAATAAAVTPVAVAPAAVVGRTGTGAGSGRFDFSNLPANGIHCIIKGHVPQPTLHIVIQGIRSCGAGFRILQGQRLGHLLGSSRKVRLKGRKRSIEDLNL